MSAVIPWRVNYRAVFGDLSESRAAAWEDYILANCRKATSEDIDKAVAALCSGEQGEHKPGVRAILVLDRPHAAVRADVRHTACASRAGAITGRRACRGSSCGHVARRRV
jgi:hypothetical protein